MTISKDNLVLMAQISSPRGLKGEMRLRSFAYEIESISMYNRFYTHDGKEISFQILSTLNANTLLIKIPTVQDRTSAEQMSGTELYVLKEDLPKVDEDEHYFSDLAGCHVFVDDKEIGEVTAIHDFGAGIFLDIKMIDTKKTATLPFNEDAVRSVDKLQKKIIANPDYILI